MAKNAIAKSATALPEHITHDPAFVTLAKDALSARSSVSQFEEAEELAKTALKLKAVELRVAEALKDNIIGILRIVKPEGDETDMTPVPIQFKMNSKDSALAMNQMPVLDELFGALRPTLWEKGKAITEITDLKALVDAIVAAGQNPMDYLKISVKDGMDNILAQYPGVTAVEGILPKTGFLTKLQEIIKNLSGEAKAYVREYLNRALSCCITMAKGKA